MIKITLKGEEERKIDFPHLSKEVKHEQYIEFKWDANEIRVFQSEQEKNGTEESGRGKYLMMVANALSNFTSEDISGFYGLPKGDLNKHKLEMLKIVMGKYDVEQLSDTLTGLYEHAFHAVMTYQPTLNREEEYSFEHKGLKYTLPSIQVDALTGKDVNPMLETGRAIEILERDRLLKLHMKTIEEGDKQKAQVEFEQDITMIALLAHQEGESFPVSQTEVDRWLNKRKAELSDIPMTIGRDLCFFLRIFIRISEKQKRTNGFLNHHKQKSQ